MMERTPPSTSIGGPPTDRPLVLFPVRLETRFTPSATGSDLLVRVYVEDVAVDWHERSLTAPELEGGKLFWEQVWRSGADDSRRRAAWAHLTERFGATRSAYIAEVLQPTNDRDRPTTPVAPDAPLTVAPVFPAPPPAGQVRGPHTRVMPDRWIAVGWVGGSRAFTVAGRPISADPLRVGPSAEAGGGFDATTLAEDPEVGWLVDFDAAEAIGMGLRIPSPLRAGEHLQRLVVLGVRGTLPAVEGADRVSELFRAHRFTDGVSILGQRTPTNNTADALSGFNSLADAFDSSPVSARPVTSPGDGSNGEVLARALGLDPRVFERVPGAVLPDQRDAFHMNTLLWKATWGYALDHVLSGPGSPSDENLRQVRDHFVSFVRGRGPLPALRVGRQPYGVLPAISLDRWTARESGAVDAPLRQVLLAAREVWRRGVAAVPRVPLSEDPAQELQKVLAMAPVAVGYAARRTTRLVRVRRGDPTTAVRSTGSGRAQDLAATLGISWAPLGLPTVEAAGPAPRVTAALVLPLGPGERAEPLSEAEPLEDNYLRALADAGTDALRAPAGSAHPALLHRLARHAALHERLGAAYRILARRGAATSAERLEPEYTDTSAGLPMALLDRPLSDLGGRRAGTLLDDLRQPLRRERTTDTSLPGAIWRRDSYQVTPGKGGTPDVAADVTDYAAFLRALDYLAGRPTAVLARALSETLDLCSHRFDAWATSLATRRLEWLRRTQPHGLYLGGYGVVEDLAPAARRAVDPPRVDPPQAAPPPELAAPLHASEGNQGYVHAPSLAHATTAAVLRSGYLARVATGDQNALAVNLSSHRVRTAMWLLDGVRQGQSLASLLGYRFERGMHENHPELVLDRYVLSFRRLAAPGVQVPAGGPDTGWRDQVAAMPASAVVDGLALVRKHRAPADSPDRLPWGVAGLLPGPGTDPTLYEACRAELDRLEDALDAVADLVLAESVHHVAQGNPSRAGATLEAVAHGEAPPPLIDVARTPRTGVGITHRLVVLLDAATVAPTWGPQTPRALAEPLLNAWVGQLLGPDAPGARCRAEFLDPSTGTPVLDGDGVAVTAEPTLDGLGLAPIDLVMLPTHGAVAQQSELELRATRRACLMRVGDVPPDAQVRLTFSRHENWPSGALGMADVLEAVEQVRRLVTASRSLVPSDLALPESSPSSTADAEPLSADAPLALRARADRAAQGLRDAVARVEARHTPVRDADDLREALLGLADFGITGAAPVTPTGDSEGIRSELDAQAASVAREARVRLERLAAVDETHRQRVAELSRATPPSVPTDAETRTYQVQRLHTVFGPELPVLPTLRAPDATRLAASLATSTHLQGGDPHQVITWLQRAARAREGAERLHRTIQYAEVLTRRSQDLLVAQLPHAAGERWVGLPLDGDATPGGRLSLVVHAPAPTDAGGPLAGLLVDEWTETVPSAQETTGLVFHYDQPGAKAPQAILLAVAPGTEATWDLETLEATVLETLELARLRMVDPAELAEAAPFLPALYLARGDGGRVVTTDLTELTRPPA